MSGELEALRVALVELRRALAGVLVPVLARALTAVARAQAAKRSGWDEDDGAAA